MGARFRLGMAVLMTAGLFGIALPSRAACAPPMVSIDSSLAKPGDVITVTGQGWMDGCDDTGGSGGGCPSRDDGAEPVENIELRLMGPKTDQTDRMLNSGYIGDTEVDILLAELGADDEGGFVEEVTLPDVPPGRYFITGIGDSPASQPPEIEIVRQLTAIESDGSVAIDHPDGWRIEIAADQKLGPLRITADSPTVSDTPDASSITHDLVFDNTSKRRVTFSDTRKSVFIGDGKPMLLAADQGCGYARLDPGAPPEAGACDLSIVEMELGPRQSGTQEVSLSWGIDGFRAVQTGTYVFEKVVEFRVGSGPTRRFEVPISYSITRH